MQVVCHGYEVGGTARSVRKAVVVLEERESKLATPDYDVFYFDSADKSNEYE
jgi:hypothetical protein